MDLKFVKFYKLCRHLIIVFKLIYAFNNMCLQRFVFMWKLA